MNIQKKIALSCGGAVLAAGLTIGGLAAANASTSGGGQATTALVSSSTPAAAAPAAPTTTAAPTGSAPTGSASDYIDGLEATLTPQQQAALTKSGGNFDLLISMLTTQQDETILAQLQSKVSTVQGTDFNAQAMREKYTYDIDALRKKLGE